MGRDLWGAPGRRNSRYTGIRNGDAVSQTTRSLEIMGHLWILPAVYWDPSRRAGCSARRQELCVEGLGASGLTCARGQSWCDGGHSQLTPCDRAQVAVAPGTGTRTPLLGGPGTCCWTQSLRCVTRKGLSTQGTAQALRTAGGTSPERCRAYAGPRAAVWKKPRTPQLPSVEAQPQHRALDLSCPDLLSPFQSSTPLPETWAVGRHEGAAETTAAEAAGQPVTAPYSKSS